MAASLGTGDKKSVNVDLNLTPFIDILSCLTLFLLVAAQWINIARLDVKPVGKGRDVPDCLDGTCDDPKLSVLLEGSDIWIGVSRVNDFTKIEKAATGYDWARLEEALKQQKSSAFFDRKTSIEIAAESTDGHPIAYQSLIAAMDVAIKVGFVDVGITEPRSLSAYPRL
ncbi:MAG TPA: biopolymer transporter ExbD [Kofleriaceae bacterium]|nr:biopolymer transporter ExbD [Kofleriaceae bacterium]